MIESAHQRRARTGTGTGASIPHFRDAAYTTTTAVTLNATAGQEIPAAGAGTTSRVAGESNSSISSCGGP